MNKQKRSQFTKLLSKFSQPWAIASFLSVEGNNLSISECKEFSIKDPGRVIARIRKRGFKIQSYRQCNSLNDRWQSEFETRYRHPAACFLA